MYVEDAYNSNAVAGLGGITFASNAKKGEQEENSLLKLFGGNDSIIISEAARERLAASKAENEKDSSGAGGEENTSAEGPGGGSGVGGSSPADQIEELEKQLKKLQAELVEVTSNESLQPAEKEARVGALQSRISQISAQIATLKAEQGKTA